MESPDAGHQVQTSMNDSSSERGGEARFQPDRGEEVALGQSPPGSPRPQERQ